MSTVIPCMKNRGRHKTYCKKDQQGVHKNLITHSQRKKRPCSESSYVSISFEGEKQVWYKWNLCVILHSMWTHRMAYSVSCLYEQVETRHIKAEWKRQEKNTRVSINWGTETLQASHISGAYNSRVSWIITVKQIVFIFTMGIDVQSTVYFSFSHTAQKCGLSYSLDVTVRC